MEEDKTTLKEEIRRLTETMSGQSTKKPKKFKMPLKGRVSKKRLREGYATIVVIGENKVVDFTREPIIDSTINVKDTFHAVDSDDIFYYKGKPLIFQPKTKINPYNPLEGKNETYGQKYVMARMEGDKIIKKKSMGWGLGIGALIIGAIILYSIMGGG